MPEVKEKILNFADRLQNPLGPKVRVQFIEKETAANGNIPIFGDVSIDKIRVTCYHYSDNPRLDKQKGEPV